MHLILHCASGVMRDIGIATRVDEQWRANLELATFIDNANGRYDIIFARGTNDKSVKQNLRATFEQHLQHFLFAQIGIERRERMHKTDAVAQVPNCAANVN